MSVNSGYLKSALSAVLLFFLATAGVQAADRDHAILIDSINQKWVGDLDGMVRDRVIRVLVVYNKTQYFLNGGQQHGITYDLMTEFEKYINNKTDSGQIPVRLVFIPVTRDRLLPSLVEGLGDIASANLTITPERSRTGGFFKSAPRGCEGVAGNRAYGRGGRNAGGSFGKVGLRASLEQLLREPQKA